MWAIILYATLNMQTNFERKQHLQIQLNLHNKHRTDSKLALQNTMIEVEAVMDECCVTNFYSVPNFKVILGQVMYYKQIILVYILH